jgi:hypothetical protein
MSEWGDNSIMRKLLPPGTIGPTGEYPDGNISDGDEGGLNAAVIVDRDNQRVVMDFGKGVAWVAMTKDDALGLARVLVSKAILLD